MLQMLITATALTCVTDMHYYYYYYSVLNQHCSCVVVELLRSIESKADEKLCELPVSSESCDIFSAKDAGDGDRLQDGHEPHSNGMPPAGGSDDTNADDIVGENTDTETSAVCRHDSEADLDTQPLHDSTAATESEFTDMLTTAQMNQCENAKSYSGHSSPCSLNADGIDTEKPPGISSWNCFLF